VAATPERKVKDKVVSVLKEYGAYYFFPAANGLGRAGIPDVISCYHSKFIAIECKAGKGVTTALQDRELNRIRSTGGIALVINEYNLDLVHIVLSTIQREADETYKQNLTRPSSAATASNFRAVR
jgi:Holliday junction resolvase